MKYRFFTALFVLALILPALVMLLRPDRTFSETENRYLKASPVLENEAVLSGTFQTELEDWLSDQFPGRNLWMACNTVMKKLEGYRDVGGAWLGKDGYLLEMHRPEDFNEIKYRRNLGYLADLAAESRIDAKALLIPCAASSLPELLPAGASSYDAAAALSAAREAMPGVEIPDLPDALRGRNDCYYRTDHHWTAAGVTAAYGCLTEGKGAYSGTTELFCEDFYGTTYSKTLDPAVKPDRVELFPLPETVSATADGEPIPVYDRSAADRKDKYTVFLGGNHGLVELSGGCKNGKTLLMLKDSFANSLAPLLTADYETVLLVDLRYYPGSVRQLLSDRNVDALLFVYEMSNLASGDDFVKLLV